MLPVSLTFAGAFALIALWLGLRVSGLRRGAGVLIGDGGHPLIAARMRAQANFVEYAPFILILMALIELASGSPRWLWAAGAATVAARLLHAFGMDRQTSNPLRIAGAGVTWLVLLALAIWAIWLAAHGAPRQTIHYL
ncbi:MAG TPA: MAPEG family protein [Sphingomonas sp.]|nr:MAPEG family protein [Sphingomonas sp.]